MTEQSNIITAPRVGFMHLLGLLFIGLKLSALINWPWWIVLLPLYGPIGLAVALAGLLATAIAGLLALEWVLTVIERKLRDRRLGDHD